MGILHTILDIVFPVNCLSCGKRGKDLCLDCLANISRAERECEPWIYPMFDYRDEKIKKAIWMLKYGGKPRIGNMFGEILDTFIAEELSELMILQNFRDPVLIPIPLSPKRLKERGYNQAEILCQKIAAGQSSQGGLVYFKNILIKIKETEHQARLRERDERLRNLTGSFAVKNKKLIEKRNIILVDDVTTTGATLSEAKKVLKQAGAKKIIAFTIAH